ncbi:LuxR C-terminal-related transcriptional regulator [Hoeflea sp. BAL378]|uniref:helix-turn-helix transcriptional regulator n=1 Tax=Hoeflea sp. BAL378 TaxID=1547437 RepID=UPI0009DD8A6C|nr:LuxR C-terminal-related transcriptional regulator [Hoeflea sp. BAL378]
MASFNTLCNQLIDMWVQSESLETPKDLYGPIIREVSIKMGLSIVETVSSDPYEWRFARVKQFSYKSDVLKAMLSNYPDSLLGDLDRSFIDRNVIPAFKTAINSKSPSIDFVKIKLLGVRVGYERLIIPQKTDGVPKWCLSLKEGRFAIPYHQGRNVDLTDEGIVQLLIEGHTAKEIAEMLELSPRSIEHRIEKLKTRFEARNLVHLVAKIVSTKLDQ